MDIRILLDQALDGAGVAIRGYLGRASLETACAPLDRATLARFGADKARGAVAAALPYGEGPAEPPPWAREWLARRPGPLASLGRFARADWYAELAARLRAAASLARSALRAAGVDPGQAREWRYLSNSGLPERPLALAAGLGSLGRQGLLLARGAGPGCVLGLLLLPFDPRAEAAEAGQAGARPGAECGDCRACLEACPTGALAGGDFRRELCIQHWSGREGALPPPVEAAWGGRLYGCDACLEACPRFKPDPGTMTGRGLLGPGIPAAWILEAGDEELRGRLRGTALGLGWMPLGAFRRNASLAFSPRNGI